MAGNPRRKKMIGRILLVQEERFRILSESGRSYLFGLAHNASVASEDIVHWHNINAHVIVEYEGEPNLEDGIAHSVKPFRTRRTAAA